MEEGSRDLKDGAEVASKYGIEDRQDRGKGGTGWKLLKEEVGHIPGKYSCEKSRTAALVPKRTTKEKVQARSEGRTAYDGCLKNVLVGKDH